MVKIIDTRNCIDACTEHLHNVVNDFNRAIVGSVSADEISAQHSRLVFALQMLQCQLNKLSREAKELAAEQYALLDV